MPGQLKTEPNKRNTGPTRGRATLDYSYTNFEDQILASEVCFPVESNVGKSDHNIVIYECMLSRPATFAWETHEYIKLTKNGTQKFNELIANQDWSSVKEKSPNADSMVGVFQSIFCLLYTSPSPRD